MYKTKILFICKEGYLFVLFVMFFYTTKAQTLNGVDKFRNQLKEVNMTFHLPNGFCPIKKVDYSWPNSKLMLNGQEYSIMNQDSIIVNFEIFLVRGFPMMKKPVDSSANITNLPSSHSNIMKTIKHFNPIDPVWLKEVGATLGVTYEPNVTYPFNKNFWYMRTVMLQRKDIGGIKLNFFSKDSTRRYEIDSLIKATWGMVRFNQDSAFHPKVLTKYLAGKFRYMRPKLSKEDSIREQEQLKKTLFITGMINGNKEEKAKKYKNAKSAYLRAQAAMPRRSAPVTALLMMYLHLGNTDSARAYLNELMDDYLPGQPKLAIGIKFGLSMLYDKEKKFDSALAVNKELIKMKPENYHIYIATGDDYFNLQRYNRAIGMYKKAQAMRYAREQKEDSYTNFQLGKCYRHLSPPDEKTAKVYFMKARKGGYDLPDKLKENLNL